MAGGETGAPQCARCCMAAPIVRGERAYLPYSGGGFVILDISDSQAADWSSDLPFSPPFHSFIAVHTAQPLIKP